MSPTTVGTQANQACSTNLTWYPPMSSTRKMGWRGQPGRTAIRNGSVQIN